MAKLADLGVSNLPAGSDLQPFFVIRGGYCIREFTAHEQLLAYLKRAERSTIRVIKRTTPGDVDVSTEYPGVNVLRSRKEIIESIRRKGKAAEKRDATLAAKRGSRT